MSYFFAFSYCSCASQGKNTEGEGVCHFLFQWTTFCQNSPPWRVRLGVALHGMAHGFIELDKAVVHVTGLVSVIVVFILSALWGIRIRVLWKLPDGRDWLWGKLDLVLIGGAMLSKSSIQFSVDGWGCVPFPVVWLRPNYGGGNEDNGGDGGGLVAKSCPTLQPHGL